MQHLGLDVPEGQCWIKVGGQKREWANGKAMAFDTHYFHETGACDGRAFRSLLSVCMCSASVSRVERETHACPPTRASRPISHIHPGNEGDKDRYVLLMRFWHPGVTPKVRRRAKTPSRSGRGRILQGLPFCHRPIRHTTLTLFVRWPDDTSRQLQEREALQYVFDALDGPEAQTDMDFDYLNGIAESQLGAFVNEASDYSLCLTFVACLDSSFVPLGTHTRTRKTHVQRRGAWSPLMRMIRKAMRRLPKGSFWHVTRRVGVLSIRAGWGVGAFDFERTHALGGSSSDGMKGGG